MANTRRKTAVPGQYLGYSLQQTRLLQRLLQAGPGSYACLEVLGDVSVADGQNGTLVEETKSRTSGSNPVSDRALDLWKTLRNWVDLVESGQVEIEKTHFYLYTSSDCAGGIIDALHGANTCSQAKDAVAKASETILGKDGKSKPAAAIAEHVERVLVDNPETLRQIALRFVHERGTGAQFDDLRQSVKRLAWIDDDLLDDVLLGMLGWVKQTTDRQIESGAPARVCYDNLRAHGIALMRKLDRRTILQCYARPPARETVEEHLETKTYVRQLELIEEDDDRKLEAVTSYLAAATNRTEWAARSLVCAASFDELNERLIDVWKNHRRRAALQLRDGSEVERGQLLYSDCLLHEARLEGREVPHRFVPGCFQQLADTQTIGWHQRYEELLSGNEEDPGDAQ